ncbi:MAG: hypothetical protein LAP38_15400 [Acidobacteriia bacterium]|nr:hypothetical protein [Terriglobia bacterium]
MRKGIGLVVTLAAAMCLSSRASADTVYSNLGSGTTVYNSGTGWSVSTVASTGFLLQPAFSFTPSGTFNFTELDIALGFINGTNSVTVDLMSDSGGSPGSVLDSWNVSGLPAFGSCCTLQALLANNTTTLASGTPFWVAVLPGAADTYAVWNLDSTGALGDVFEDQGSGFALFGADATVGAFQVLGDPSTAVPEPRSGMLAVIAAGMLAMFTRRTLHRKS